MTNHIRLFKRRIKKWLIFLKWHLKYGLVLFNEGISSEREGREAHAISVSGWRKSGPLKSKERVKKNKCMCVCVYKEESIEMDRSIS